MRIALDAMGGDHAPREIVAGAVRAAQELPGLTRLILVGDEQSISRELDSFKHVPDCLTVLHASEVIEMHEKPAQAIRRKKDSSIARAIDLVKDGEADAVVSAGHTGAMVAGATLKLRRLKGVSRPAIAAVLPTENRPLVLVDAGANPECDARLFTEFAIMGSVYSGLIFKQSAPIVGLLSIGEEELKGTEKTREAFDYLSKAPLNFRGNVEGHDVFKGETDVIVCDGFTGNIVLKTSESVAGAIMFWLKRELSQTPMRKLGAALARGGLVSMKERLDPESYGGALLLGVNGVCVITHGASSSNAIFHAVRVAGESLEHQLNTHIVEQLSLLEPEAATL